MKRILISLVSSTCLMIFYITTLFFLEMGSLITEETSHKLATPFRLPSYIYYDVLKLQSHDENLMESIIWVSIAILINIILYASFVYLISMLIPRKVKKLNALPEPPIPPIFQEENKH